MTREEAINNVRSFIGQLTTECQDSIRTLIPELRKSEDEMIRKELVALFIEVRNREGNEGYWHDLKVADILAYLEKQKEQKPAEWSEEDERILTGIIERGSCQIPFTEPALRGEQMEWLLNLLKSIRSQLRRIKNNDK